MMVEGASYSMYPYLTINAGTNVKSKHMHTLQALRKTVEGKKRKGATNQFQDR